MPALPALPACVPDCLPGNPALQALRNLKKTRLEVDLLAEQLQDSGIRFDDEAAAALGKAPGQPASQPQGSRVGLHSSVAALAAASWWFYTQDFPAIQRKLVFTLLFPVRKPHAAGGHSRQAGAHLSGNSRNVAACRLLLVGAGLLACMLRRCLQSAH